ncbi:MAG: cytochrome c maturation protein CcmE [Candidatus Odinarchaeota archaeon]
MVKPRNVIIAVTVILVCSGAILLLLASSSVPVFTVKDLMNDPDHESLINRKIQLIGVVDQVNDTGFFITDPDDVSNSTLIIYIEAVNVEKPTGFEIGKTVLVEGKLLSIDGIWKFKASMISTKCPSKYQS